MKTKPVSARGYADVQRIVPGGAAERVFQHAPGHVPVLRESERESLPDGQTPAGKKG